MPSRHSQDGDAHGRAHAGGRARRRAAHHLDRRGHRSRNGGDARDAAGRRAHRAHTPERAGAPARPAHVELGELVRRALPANRRHEREGRRLHDDGRRPRGRALGHRQRAEDRRHRAARAAASPLRLRGHRPDARNGSGPGARRRASRRKRADAVPGARRLPASLRRRKDVARRSRDRARPACSRDATPTQAHDWATRFTQLFSQSIYKWVQSPLSLHVGSLDLDRERALQMPVVQKTEWTQDAKATKDAKPAKSPGSRRAHVARSRNSPIADCESRNRRKPQFAITAADAQCSKSDRVTAASDRLALGLRSATSRHLRHLR